MRVNSFKARAAEFIKSNPDLKRKQYVAAFVEMGMSEHSASLYHYILVTKDRKQVKIVAPVKVGPARDARGRFIKKAA